MPLPGGVGGAGSCAATDVVGQKPVTAVDLFCGAGGLTRGLLNAGISVRAGYDIDESCRYPFESNNGVPFVKADVREINPDDLHTVLGGEPNLVAGCAPCQPYSILTNARDQTKDSRAHLLGEFCRIAMALRPTYVTMENVPGLRNKSVFFEFLRELEQNDYWYDWRVADSSRYGVPQRRQRLVLVGSRAAPIELPRPRRGRPPGVRGTISRLPRLAAGGQDPSDPLHRAADLSGLNLRRVQASSPGGTWRDWSPRLKLRCHSSPRGQDYIQSYGRALWSAPSAPITTKFFNLGSGRFGHPEQDRAFSLREGALLQTFPADYRFCPPEENPSLAPMARLIGNAVPVRLAEAIGRTIAGHAATQFTTPGGR